VPRTKWKISKRDAILIVDTQRDFCPGGALPVPEGDAVVPALNEYVKIFREAGAAIYATRDWHPPNHISFKEQGGSWPAHCVQNTRGAEFHPDLGLPKGTAVISKATDPDEEAYSGFDGTNLEKELRLKGVKRVFIGGVATDYCVKSTVLDAIRLGFETVLLEDAARGVDVKPGDSKRAIEEMVAAGAKKTTLSDLTSWEIIDIF
jgi:nicotinamidase/pyrazinamidase